MGYAVISKPYPGGTLHNVELSEMLAFMLLRYNKPIIVYILYRAFS